MVVGDHLFRRLQNAIASVDSNSAEVGTSDIASLVRQALLRCCLELEEGGELRVPKKRGWPSHEDWEKFGCDVRSAGKAHYLLNARRWVPPWLDKNANSVIEASIREIKRRETRSVPSDPLVTELAGLPEYVTPGQRAAVQAAFLMPAGSTVIIDLPTGGGKTLAFQLPALAWADQGGLTVVVVPTTALAKDQEARFLALTKKSSKNRSQSARCLAYHSQLADDLKHSVREGIRQGQLPILFASPEAIIGALRGPLFEAARQGRLRVFAVDEAHVVAQWGQQFRPEFQSIAGLKDALLDVCPPNAQFRTLLLTATLTEESYDALKFLFGRGGCQLVSEVALRLEPGFLLESATGEAERTRHVLEAVRFLPRPLILYTTLRDQALRFYQELLNYGYRRVRIVRGGDMGDPKSDQLLKDWRNGAVDVVVATSAFGLGMDQDEVRSVVHACLPENIDRYYQEVGRSGRDGNASTALLISTSDDVNTAEGLSTERIISVDRGFERWEAMWLRRRKGEHETYIVSLDDRPTDIAAVGSYNVSWNLRTLVLMARVGLIEFAPHQPPIIEREPQETVLEFEERRHQRLDEFSREVSLKIRDPRHSDRAHWDQAVARIRKTLRAGDQHEARLVRELRDLRRPLNEIFRDVYTLIDPPVRPPIVAGSCPVTRERDTVSFQMADPEVNPIANSNLRLTSDLERGLAPCSDEVGRSWISYGAVSSDAKELRRWRDKILALLRFAVTGGVVEFSVPEDVLSEKDWASLTVRSANRFLIRDWLTGEIGTGHVRVPRLTLIADKFSTMEHLERTMLVDRPRHIIVAPNGLGDPRAPQRMLFDMVRNLSIEDVLSRLQS
jgi:superfamily II DNA/RNA helicase